MKIERLGVCLSVLVVTVLAFAPISKNEENKTIDLYSQPKEISYKQERSVDLTIVKNMIDDGINILKANTKKYVKKQELKKEEKKEKKEEKKKEEKTTTVSKTTETKKEVSTKAVEKKVEVKKQEPKKVFDNLTMEQLTAKLNKSLNSTLSNKGNIFAKYSIQYGVDPYLATAIALHETGCAWNCSNLVKQCNNVGGQKGSPGCGGGSYKSFKTLDAGIEGFISNLYYNYYKQGLNTPEKMNSKYAASTSWATQVNNYIKSIKSK